MVPLAAAEVGAAMQFRQELTRGSSSAGGPVGAVPLARSQDVGALKISELRSLVHAAGLSTAGCIEIADLRERAREALAVLDPPAAADVDI